LRRRVGRSVGGTLCAARRGGRAVECGGLENRYGSLGSSRVQIPPSPLYLSRSRSTRRDSVLRRALLGRRRPAARVRWTLSVANAVTMSVVERTREIGILRCVGARARDVRRTLRDRGRRARGGRASRSRSCGIPTSQPASREPVEARSRAAVDPARRPPPAERRASPCVTRACSSSLRRRSASRKSRKERTAPSRCPPARFLRSRAHDARSRPEWRGARAAAVA
jgi:hypothetical protein